MLSVRPLPSLAYSADDADLLACLAASALILFADLFKCGSPASEKPCDLTLTPCSRSAIDSGLPGPQLDQRRCAERDSISSKRDEANRRLTHSEFLVLAYTIFSRHSEIQSAILKGIAQRGAKVISCVCTDFCSHALLISD